MRRLFIAGLVLAGLGAAPGAAAQTGAERALDRVKLGERLKVEVSGAVWIGTYQRFDRGELLLSRDSVVERLAVDRVSGIWVRGRATKAGAIVGGIGGAGFGAFLGLMVAGLCEYDCPGRAGAMTIGGMLGGVAGAALGAIVGAAIPRWKLVF